MVPATQKPTLGGAEAYLDKFRHFESEAGQAAWVYSLRKAGLARFAELGFPTLQHEDWRFTNVAPIAKLPFKPVFEVRRDRVSPETAGQFAFACLPGPRLVFVDGHFAPTLSSARDLPAGVSVVNLASALTTDAALVEGHLGRHAQNGDDAFTALNQAFFLDGGLVHLAAGTVLGEPIKLVHVSTAKQSGATLSPRNLILAGANSQATILESYVTVGGGAYFTNAVTELVVEEGGRLEFLKFQNEGPDAYHVATLHGEFGRGSRVTVHSFALGARLSRSNLRAKLAGEGLECVLNGLYLTQDEQLADHHMIVEHVQPRCVSHEYFNGILDDKSRGVFHGRILVRPAAQKTDAKQTNKNLLLSDDATVNTKPQLEIYADDVKCTHGATVGQLNAESIFYLRTRGIGIEAARRMLIHAFAGEIIERIRHPAARAELDLLVGARLGANPHLAER